MSSQEKKAEFEPKIVAFLCKWCSYRGADLAGTSRFKHPPNIRVIRVMCSGSIDPVYKTILPPRKRLWVEFNQENVAAVPEKEGVFQLLDEQETVIFIKGAMNLKQELTDQLELNQEAKFFMFIEDQMFSKRESEMLQHYIIEHGKMPKTNQEMEDLF
jgi:hypothetical protein